MIKQNLIIFEDSSKVSFGGGQNITLQVCELLAVQYNNLIFVDFTDKSRYIERVKEQYPENNFIFLKSNYWHFTKLNFIKEICELLNLFFYGNKNICNLKNNIDIFNSLIYATTRKALIYSIILNRCYGIPFIYHAHLVEDVDRLQSKIILRFLRNALKVICVSKIVKQSIELDNTVLLYNPKPIDQFPKQKKKNSKFVIAAIGSLISIKGFEYFIEAAHQVPSDIEFRIYGEGILKEKLENSSKGRVKFMGFSENIIMQMNLDIDIVVLPTIIREALPTVLIEAKSVGLPVIVTNIGGQSEIVTDDVDGLKVPIKCSKAIADKIILLTSDLGKYNEMAKASYFSSKLFSKQNFKTQIIQILKDSHD